MIMRPVVPTLATAPTKNQLLGQFLAASSERRANGTSRFGPDPPNRPKTGGKPLPPDRAKPPGLTIASLRVLAAGFRPDTPLLVPRADGNGYEPNCNGDRMPAASGVRRDAVRRARRRSGDPARPAPAARRAGADGGLPSRRGDPVHATDHPRPVPNLDDRVRT